MDVDQARSLLLGEPLLWTREYGQIVDKRGKLVDFVPNEGQTALVEALMEQREQGKPMRAVVLKARQIGFSTVTQALLILRSTLMEHHSAIVVAHDRETGGKLYRMGERFYRSLPEEKWLKPEIASHRRARHLHFANRAKEAWQRGHVWPDSTYGVDTAGEFQAGRGGTYHSVHASEVAFWDDITAKLTALRSAVPRDPDTLIILESTANGHNEFKEEWDRAESGESDYLAFFWPWWKEPTYSQPFMNEAEREAFAIGDGPYGEEEPELVEKFGLTKEQLHWRRTMIANELGGDLRMFQQEFPAYPEQAFLATGSHVFDPALVQVVLDRTKLTDPKAKKGKLEAGEYVKRAGRMGEVEVPEQPKWVPLPPNGIAAGCDWRIWNMPHADRQYVIGVDVSGGETTGGNDPAAHAIEVIDHLTGDQVAEYSSRIDPDLLSDQVYMAGRFYNDAWIAVERTGSWGQPIIRRLWNDYAYPFLYETTSLDRREDKRLKSLGWDTNRKTKPLLIAYGQELLREGSHGIVSRALAMEMRTYVRDEKGKTDPEPGKFSDRLMAWLIAQQVAQELPVKRNYSGDSRPRHTGFRARDPVTGY